MLPSSAIAKGKILENYIVERLRLSGLDIRAARTPGSGNGLEKGDITNDLNISIECKNQKRFSPEWITQANRQSLGNVPVVVWHPPRQPLDQSVAIIPWWYLEELLQRNKAPITKEPDRAMKWKLEQLKKAASDVLKEL